MSWSYGGMFARIGELLPDWDEHGDVHGDGHFGEYGNVFVCGDDV